MSQHPPQDPQGQYPPPQPPYGQPSGPTPREPGIATVALVLGILAILLSPLLIFGIAALIVGIIAVNQTGGPRNIPGRGKAIAGVAMGGSSFAVAIVVMLIIAITLPAIGAARRTARRMQNSTQMRGVHQGLVMTSSSNRANYAGLDAMGNIIEDRSAGGQSLNDYPGFNGSGDGDSVEARYWQLFAENAFTPEFAISPSEVGNVAIYDPGSGSIPAPVVWNAGSGDKHYSYAMLSIEGEPGRAPAARARADEWKDTFNSRAIVLSDRNTGSGTSDTQVRSIHTDDPGDWKGTVVWNDNHVGFEQTHNAFETKYGNGQINTFAGPGGTADDLFKDANIPAGNSPGQANALMVVDGDSGVSGNE
ncbi:MAG: DUF4190 domain-containing protein [Planctomycetota bacterium]